jgi:hypothetical protein
VRFVFRDKENLNNWDQYFSTDYTLGLDLGVRSMHGVCACVNSMTVSVPNKPADALTGRTKTSDQP